MSHPELIRKKQKKTALIKKIAYEAQEKNWYIPSLEAVKENDKYARRAQQQLRKKQRLLPRIYRSETQVEPKEGSYRESIKEDILCRESEYGGVTDVEIFKRSSRQTHQSINDVDILQRIVVRESILVEISNYLKDSDASRAAAEETDADNVSILNDHGQLAALLQALRSSTVEVIELIACWRAASNCVDKVFVFRGTNYLLKIACDLDYLDRFPDVREYFGFRFSDNPFSYAAGGHLTDPSKDDADISGYFAMQLSLDGVQLARIRNCEREIRKERLRCMNSSSNSSSSSGGGQDGERRRDHAVLSTAGREDAEDAEDGAADEANYSNSNTNNLTKSQQIINNFQVRFKLENVLKERITNLKKDRKEILQREASIASQIDQLVLKRNRLNAYRRYIATADSGVLAVDVEVFGQHLSVQESVYATNAQYLDSKILDLQRQKALWESERLRKKLLCQRLQDEYEADTRRIVLQEKVKKELHKRGLVATLELLSEYKKPRTYPLRTSKSKKASIESRKEVNGDMQRMSKSNKLRIVKEFAELQQINELIPDIEVNSSIDEIEEGFNDGTEADPSLLQQLEEVCSDDMIPIEVKEAYTMEGNSTAIAAIKEIAYVNVHEWFEDAMEAIAALQHERSDENTAEEVDEQTATDNGDMNQTDLLSQEQETEDEVFNYEQLFAVETVEEAAVEAEPLLEGGGSLYSELGTSLASAPSMELGDESAAAEVVVPPKKVGYDVSVSAYRVIRAVSSNAVASQYQRRNSSISKSTRGEYRYAIIAIDPAGVHWTIDRSFNELKQLYNAVSPHYVSVFRSRHNLCYYGNVEGVLVPVVVSTNSIAASSDASQSASASASVTVSASSNKQSNKKKDSKKQENKSTESSEPKETIPVLTEQQLQLAADIPEFNEDAFILPFPKPLTVLYPTLWHHMERAKEIQAFLMQILEVLEELSSAGQELIMGFLEIGELVPSYFIAADGTAYDNNGDHYYEENQQESQQ